MAIKKGDNIIVITGKNKGVQAKVALVLPKTGQLVVDGVNMRKKRERPRKAGEQGQVVSRPAPIDASNVLLYCSSCKKGVRHGIKIDKKERRRVCRKCGSTI